MLGLAIPEKIYNYVMGNAKIMNKGRGFFCRDAFVQMLLLAIIMFVLSLFVKEIYIFHVIAISVLVICGGCIAAMIHYRIFFKKS